jgi:hypothetical protein
LDIFLVPQDLPFIHFLGTRSQDKFDSNVFFIRIHDWSVKLLMKVLNTPNVHQEYQRLEHPVQKAFDSVLRSHEFMNNVVYQPRRWYNHYHTESAEEMPGHLLVHYDVVGGDKWVAMADIISLSSSSRRKLSIPLEQTTYTEEIDRYWNSLRTAYRLLNLQLSRSDKDEKVSNAVRRLDYALHFEADSKVKMDEANTGLKDALGLQGDDRNV